MNFSTQSGSLQAWRLLACLCPQDRDCLSQWNTSSPTGTIFMTVLSHELSETQHDSSCRQLWTWVCWRWSTTFFYSSPVYDRYCVALFTATPANCNCPRISLWFWYICSSTLFPTKMANSFLHTTCCMYFSDHLFDLCDATLLSSPVLVCFFNRIQHISGFVSLPSQVIKLTFCVWAVLGHPLCL